MDTLEGITRLNGAGKQKSIGDESGKLEEVSRDFEGILIGQFFRLMSSTIGEGGIIEKSFQRSIYEDMLQNEFARVFSRRGGFRLHEILVKRLGARSNNDLRPTEACDVNGEAADDGLKLKRLNRRFMKIEDVYRESGIAGPDEGAANSHRLDDPERKRGV